MNNVNMSTKTAAGLPTLDMNTAIATRIPDQELLVAFSCGCTYMRIIQNHKLVTTTEEEDFATMEAPPIVADNICLMCDMVKRINADLEPVTLAVTSSTKSGSLDVTTKHISKRGKQRGPSLHLITDFDQLNEPISPGIAIYSAIVTGLTIDDEFSSWAARWVAEHVSAIAPMDDREFPYLADDELSPMSLVSPEDDFSSSLTKPVGRILHTGNLPELIECCHCSRCREYDEVSPTTLVAPRVCTELLRTIEADYIPLSICEIPLVDDDVSPLGGQALDDGLFDEALALLDDDSDDASDMVRWTLDSSDSQTGMRRIDARDSLYLPYHRQANDQRQSIYSEASFDLPIQHPNAPITTKPEDASDQSRHISIVGAQHLEWLLEPYRVDGVFDETAETMYPIKQGPPSHLFRKRKSQTTKKFLLTRIKDNIVRKLKAIFRGGPCKGCEYMRE